MLIEFKVKNFLSIKDEVTLSMLPTSDTSLQSNIITKNNEKYLRYASIYGANASGKTNVLKAMKFVRELVVNNTRIQSGEKIDVVPFKLDMQFIIEPSEFEIHFIQNNVRYVYGLVLDKEQVYEEYLYSYPKGRQKTIFERWDTEQFRFTSDKEEQKALSKRTLPNRLYLSNATEWNYVGTREAFNWFQQKLVVWEHDEFEKFYRTSRIMEQDENIKQIIVQFLNKADFGINDIEIRNEEVSRDNISSLFNKSIRTDFNFEEQKIVKVDVDFLHKGKDIEGNSVDVEFNIKEESTGTKKLFNFLGPWIKAIMTNQVIFCDEVENSIHPLLMRKLIQMFQEATNSEAQFIFTTHNTYLLDNELFRRDQIWFTEKNPGNNDTDLYSLSAVNPRKEDNYAKGYIKGRYGGIPIIGEGLSRVLWQENEEHKE